MKKVLITGCSSGLGKSLAIYYLERGYSVYSISRRIPEGLVAHPHFYFKQLDLQNFEKVIPTLNKLLEDVVELECAILNAGILGHIQDMKDCSIKEFKEVMDINVWSNKLVLDSLFAANICLRQVIGISSGAAVVGKRGWSAYAMSKASLNMLIQLYATERPETHFTALAPGLVDTAMQDYICEEVNEYKYKSIQTLKIARELKTMPSASDAAYNMAQSFSSLLNQPSGSFQDLRVMENN